MGPNFGICKDIQGSRAQVPEWLVFHVPKKLPDSHPKLHELDTWTRWQLQQQRPIKKVLFALDLQVAQSRYHLWTLEPK